LKGHVQVRKEYDGKLRQLTMMGYGVILISHSTEKTFTDEEGVEYTRTIPTLEPRAQIIVNRLVDFIGLAKTVHDKSTGEYVSRLCLRETPRFIAGSRYKYIPREIDLSYDSLVSAIHAAIDKEAAERNGEFLQEAPQPLSKAFAETVDYNVVKPEFDRLTAQILAIDPLHRSEIKEIVQQHLGKEMKVSDCPRSQAGVIELINLDLEAFLESIDFQKQGEVAASTPSDNSNQENK